MLTTLPIVVAVHPSLPVRSMQDLVAYAKARPGTLNFSSNGRGSVSFLAAEIFKHTAGIRMEHVPYKGAAPGTMAIVAGEVQLGFVDSSAAMPQARAGTVRALAITDPKRSSIVPDLPTIAESGFPGYAVSAWVALFAPGGTPAPVVDRLNAEVTRVLKQLEVREMILKAQMEPAPDSAENLAQLIRRELELYGSVIQKAGIKAE
jgi:tripartite-type tricarboxylate transporter receptor subunit TctC